MSFLANAQRAELTQTEQMIAAYIANNAEDVVHMPLRDLASAAFASPASVSRLSRKLGYGSYGEMQVDIARELAEDGSLSYVDADFPELDGSSPVKLAGTLAALDVRAIRDTQKLMERVSLNPIVNEIVRRRMVCVLGSGFSNTCAHTFAANLQRLGYTVLVETDWSRMRTIAAKGDTMFLPILISYSGMTDVVDLARLFVARGMRTLSITSDGSNELRSLTTWNLPVARLEKVFANDRVAPITSVIATEYVLDLLYLAVFDRDRDKNARTLTEAIVQQLDALHEGNEGKRGEGVAMNGTSSALEQLAKDRT